MSMVNRIQLLSKEQGSNISNLEKSCGLGRGTIRRWDDKLPSVDKVLKVADMLNASLRYLITGEGSVRSDSNDSKLTVGQNEVLKAIEPLTEPERIKIAGAIPFVVSFQRGQSLELPAQPNNILPLPKKEAPAAPEQTVGVSVFDMPASAGTGLYLDSENYTLVEFPESVVPRQTSFAVRLRGNSMMPDFEDGDIVFVKRQPSLESGDIGIFCLDNNAYCKRLLEKNGESYLVSLNKKYPPIEIKEMNDLRVLGQVLGRTSGDF